MTAPVASSSPVKRVKRWAPVAAALGHWQESSAGLRHVGITVLPHAPKPFRSTGQVLWATDLDDSVVGIAWSWTCLHGDVVVMTNPMALATNLALVDDESGEPLTESQLMCCLNASIHLLPWQEHVRRAI